MPFNATQYFNADEPSFHWQVDVSRFSVKMMKGRDFFTSGKGYMKIILLSLFKMVDDADNDKINSGSMLRYLAETCWFPSAALHGYIKWEAADNLSAKATMSYKGVTVTGLFYFNEKGELKKFSADRYFGTGDTAKIEKWEVETRGYKTFQGINIPTKCKVIWKLHDGDFSWANLEVLAIEYNVKTMYDS